MNRPKINISKDARVKIWKENQKVWKDKVKEAAEKNMLEEKNIFVKDKNRMYSLWNDEVNEATEK